MSTALRPHDPPTGIDPTLLSTYNRVFDARYEVTGNLIVERKPINWVPVPEGFDRRLENFELDEMVLEATWTRGFTLPPASGTP